MEDRWPVSVKGVLGWGNRFVVLRNHRGEWELPGGRLEATDHGPVETVRRELCEEIGLDVAVGSLVDSWVYKVEGKSVLILTYRCEADEPEELQHSDEHTEVALMDLAGLADLLIPAGYLRSIREVAAG
ncbi:MAG: NUDIX domain-containing protein [Acidimicrobiales bacterium]